MFRHLRRAPSPGRLLGNVALPANRMMAGYATPYARVADVRNKLMLPFEEQNPPAAATPGEVPDQPMPGWPAPMIEPDFSGIPEPPMPGGVPGQMGPPPPGLRGKGYVSGEPTAADWAFRLQRLQNGNSAIDPRMEKEPPEPAIPGPGYTLRGVPQENLIQQAPGGVQVEGWLPASATQTPMNPNDPRYAQWLRLMRQRGSI